MSFDQHYELRQAVWNTRILRMLSALHELEVRMTKATAHPDRRLISSESVHGTDVYGMGDEAIGQIDHLLIEKVSGRVVRSNELWRFSWPRP
jgi:hypothetical protein